MGDVYRHGPIPVPAVGRSRERPDALTARLPRREHVLLRSLRPHNSKPPTLGRVGLGAQHDAGALELLRPCSPSTTPSSKPLHCRSPALSRTATGRVRPTHGYGAVEAVTRSIPLRRVPKLSDDSIVEVVEPLSDVDALPQYL